jgi:site-specific DNA-adenine methylase
MELIPTIKEESKPIPFIWIGNKVRMLTRLQYKFQHHVNPNGIFIDAFMGSGAVSLHVLRTYPNIRVFAAEKNQHIVNLFQCIKKNPEAVYAAFEMERRGAARLQGNGELQKARGKTLRTFFRSIHHYGMQLNFTAAGWYLFLLQIVFNGDMEHQSINEDLINGVVESKRFDSLCNELKGVSELLQRCVFLHDYKDTAIIAKRDTFTYFDPPYEPLPGRKRINYNYGDPWGKISLIILSKWIKEWKGNWLLSNEDVPFVRKLFSNQGCYMERVPHTRASCGKVGNIQSVRKGGELLVFNF